MVDVQFNVMIDDRHAAEVVAMMRDLYAEDHPCFPADPQRFPATIQTFLANPAQGRIVMFTQGEAICGYAILIPYWSNEYGGILLHVDELYVMREVRSRGIGRAFFEFLKKDRPYEAVAVALEVSPSNIRARLLYESLGFAPRRNTTLMYRFAPPQ